MLSSLDQAIQLATDAHNGQKDKGGNFYILHPLHLMNQMETVEEKMVAVLHDVLEDASWIECRFTGCCFPQIVVTAVRTLTRLSGESYDDFITRISQNKIATKVKIADLEHNMDIRRLKEITEQDRKRLNKYLKAWNRLRNG